MSRYCYPAVFTLEEQGVFSIVFPDLEGCYTCGDDLTDGIMMAEDVLAFTMKGKIERFLRHLFPKTFL